MTKPGLADVLPLSPLQEGMLFLALYDERSVDAYTVQLGFDLEGRVDPAGLRAAGDALLRRHPNLRAGFRHEKLSRPVQVIPHEVELDWQEADLRDGSDQARRTALDELVERDRTRRFDLAAPPLIRFTLARLADERYRLVVTLHHILLDGWSFPLLVDDLFELYAQRGDESGRPKVTPYRDYLAWLSRQDRDAAAKAWRTALDGVTEPTLLVPGAGQRVDRMPEEFSLELPAELTERLTALARSRGWTLNTVVQGAWGLLLSSLTGRDDVVFGTTVSGRPPEVPGVEAMVGLFINTLPVRVRLDPAESLGQLLGRLQDQHTELMDHQHLGLTQIQRETGTGALFDTLAVFENYPFDPAALDRTVDGVRVSGFSGAEATHYPLSLIAYPGERIRLRVGHRPEFVDRAAAEAAAARLTRVLEAVAADPDQRVAAVDALAADERERVLERWNDTAYDVRPDTLPRLFEARAAAVRDHPAVVFEGTEVSYADLNARANRLARHLIAQGVGPERTVALAVPRSVELIVALLAVTKTGAAYLPVDPDHPRDRTSYVLSQARPALVLTTAAAAGGLPTTDAPVLVLDAPEQAAALADHADTDVQDAERTAPLTQDHPAYVIYTSGSTGRPKGVVVPHRGIVNRLAWMQGQYGLAMDDRVLQKTPAGFDVSVWEFFWTLTEGATLVVARPGGHKDPAYLAGLVRDQRVTTLHFVPSMLQEFLQEPAAVRCAGLRRVLCSGEALPDPLRERFFSVLTAELHNLYGPTEASVDVTYWQCEAGHAPGPVPIGRPVWNTRTLVLDAMLRPVAPGVAGDLYLAGAQLARGYLDRPDLTAERFVADPYGPAGGRMYRTGDVARWTDQGVLEFLGRADDQVKLRGFRIELGEIEAALTGHPRIAAAAVVVREDRAGDQRLVAYPVAADPADAPDSADLRAHLAAAVPDYMVPSAFVPLDRLPLSANGKLDRKALPAPDAVTGGIGRAPRTPREEILCGLFAEVLGVDRVGPDDDFFALGGHSLLATRLVSRIRSAFGVELAVGALFEAPTAARLETELAHAGDARPGVRPYVRPEVLPLSHAQRGQWVVSRIEEGSSAYHIPYATRLSGELDRVALRAALGDVVGRHESLRTVFVEVDGVPRQVVRSSVEVPFAESVVSREGLGEALSAAVARPFDLADDVLLRAELFSLAETEHVLLLTMHHIGSDGWSLSPLARDLSAAYTARCAGRAPVWPELPVQYADFALWQREVLGVEGAEGSVFDRQVGFWRERLAGLPEELALPVDRARPAVLSGRGDVVEFGLTAEVHRGLVGLARESRASVFMVVQAALAGLLSRLGAGQDIAVGTAIAGRTDEALDDLVGFFVNTLVLRTDVSGDPSFRELVDRVRESDLSAFAHQDVPFERLVEAINPQRSAARHPLFQVMLNLQNNPEPQLTLDGITVEPQPVDVAVSKFDLSFDLTERHGHDGAADGVHGEIRYSVDLFDRGTVEALVGRFVRLLEAVVADPEVRLGRVEILSGRERSRLLEEWNGPVLEVPVRSLPALVEAQVVRTPDAVALVEGEVSLSYRELNGRANRLARLLVGMGVGPERIVALALPRSVSQVVALLAVVKAGGAYLPVDPDYPAERISYMLGDADPALLLTDQATAAGLPETPDLARLVLDESETRARVDALAGTDLGDGERLAALSVDHPAYVIYTSGSTGRPKGVVVTHRSLSDYLDWTSRSYPSAAGAALLHSPVSFDLSVTALYTPLVVGGAVHLAGLEEDPAAERALAGRPVTFLKATPSHLPLLAALPDAFSPGNELLLGGEALFGEALQDWRARHPGATVLNVYGPTEGTVNVAEFRIEPGDEVPSGPVPIGRPQGNARLYVLDEGLRLAPPGAAGELYIAGTALARGYLNRAALTAERFVADPYGAPGARMYRTGDLARRRADGELEYVGRADDQVKLRGFRIELGEIETVLAGHPEVERAVVVVREDQPGERRLIGYAVPAAGARPDAAALRARVADAVPDYMVPAAVVLLDALPLTAHGKLDRAALPAPDFAATVTKQGPRTPQERILCEIFADLLDLSEVGVHDSFFDLGGDSIISIQLVSRARKAGLSLTPRAVFQHKTVEALAAHAGTVGKRVGKGTDTGVGSVPLTPIIHRLRDRGGPIAKYAQSVLLQVPADLGEEALETTVQSVLDHHDALRMRLTRPEGGGEWSLEVPPRGTVRAAESITRVDVTGLTGDALGAAIETEAETAWARLSPERGRMLEAVWFDAGPGASGRLLVIIHHLVVDGVSWRILETDLAAAWQAAKEGRRAELQPVGTSFKRWAEHLVASAYAPERVKEAELWSSTLDVPDPLLSERPLDPSQDMNHTMGGLWQILPPELTGPLLTKVPAAFNAGVNDVLLTALALAVAHWRRSRGGEDHPAVLVDLEGHGREEFTDGVDLSRTVGWFSSIYPVRLDPGRLDWREVLAGGPAVGDALKQVKEQLRGIPDNGLGFGLLRHLNLDTKPALAGFLPRQIGFNYLGRFDMAGRAEYADWAAAPEKAPGFSDRSAPMMYALSLNAVTEDHADGPRLRVAWAFPGALFREPEVKELSEVWAQVLQALVTHVEGGASGGHTPSDLPLVSLSQQEIDELEDELDDESDDDELDEEWGITR
ncbi:hypothetical protein GCM10009548_94410 [Streptomyces malaysiensis subsp. malaysiensis]|uniref:Amino acid adenylation domain-containing protein n=1 Tax=Streptomyces malaysiensis TaxID=92644 RepID=A0ABX6WC83_STRMQ|nr:non-ribosomal peptide synthetase [Streptomyces solisilvae]QPI59050.1 amino acid adenylation domain-containing protein [Streptomyces solisilvae]